MTRKCIACGGTDLISDVSVIDPLFESQILFRHQQNPSALLFKGDRKVPAQAQVCGDCGHVMLYTTQAGITKLRRKI